MAEKEALKVRQLINFILSQRERERWYITNGWCFFDGKLTTFVILFLLRFSSAREARPVRPVTQVISLPARFSTLRWARWDRFSISLTLEGETPPISVDQKLINFV